MLTDESDDALQQQIELLNRRETILERRIELLQKAYNRHVDLATFWHGKFALIKHENNQLRRKINRKDHSDQ